MDSEGTNTSNLQCAPVPTIPWCHDCRDGPFSHFLAQFVPCSRWFVCNTKPLPNMMGKSCDYHLHCCLEYGKYVQVHETHDNSMATCTTGAIALHPTRNVRGGYFFMSLTTGQWLNCYAWTPFTMPHKVIERVHVLLAQRSKANNNVLKSSGWRDAAPILDEEGKADDNFYDPNDV